VNHNIFRSRIQFLLKELHINEFLMQVMSRPNNPKHLAVYSMTGCARCCSLFSCDNVVVMTQENVFGDENFFVLHIALLYLSSPTLASNILLMGHSVFISQVLSGSMPLDLNRILQHFLYLYAVLSVIVYCPLLCAFSRSVPIQVFH
jgi:hypothetical protein